MKNRGVKIAAAVAVASGLLWALGIVDVVAHSANKMVGFHPLLLFAAPVWGAIALASSILLFTRWRLVGCGGIIAGVCVGVALLNLHTIWKWSYAYHIAEYSKENESALAGLKTTRQLTTDQFFSGVYDVTNLVPVTGANWYDKNGDVASGGTFWGGNVAGVPHVRLEKVRHGWWGLALVDSTNDLARLELTSFAKYSPTAAERLWTWNTGQ